jgi:periodic tryptophan protein 2
VRLWDVFGGGRAKETLQHGADVLALAYRNDGQELAVATLDGQIALWDLKTMCVHTHTLSATGHRNGHCTAAERSCEGRRLQTGVIEARRDITGGRSVWDRRSAINSTANKAFTSLCYTADGQCLLAGGASKYVCIYDVRGNHVAPQAWVAPGTLSTPRRGLGHSCARACCCAAFSYRAAARWAACWTSCRTGT